MTRKSSLICLKTRTTPFITAPIGVLRGCSGLFKVAPRPVGVHPEDIGVILSPRQNSVVTPIKKLFKPRHPSSFCVFHSIQLSALFDMSGVHPTWGAPRKFFLNLTCLGRTPKGFVDLTGVGGHRNLMEANNGSYYRRNEGIT